MQALLIKIMLVRVLHQTACADPLQTTARETISFPHQHCAVNLLPCDTDRPGRSELRFVSSRARRLALHQHDRIGTSTRCADAKRVSAGVAATLRAQRNAAVYCGVSFCLLSEFQRPARSTNARRLERALLESDA